MNYWIANVWEKKFLGEGRKIKQVINISHCILNKLLSNCDIDVGRNDK